MGVCESTEHLGGLGPNLPAFCWNFMPWQEARPAHRSEPSHLVQSHPTAPGRAREETEAQSALRSCPQEVVVLEPVFTHLSQGGTFPISYLCHQAPL